MAPQATQYGFRHDPMGFVKNGKSVAAALVRAQVFHAPQPGDEEVIDKHVAEILAKQRPGGSFGDKADDTGRSLDWLAMAGVRADRREFKRGFEAMMRQRQEEAAAGKGNDYGQEGLVLVPVNGLRAACMTDFKRTPEVRATLRWLTAHPEVWLNKTCPWGATFVLKSLWYARDVEDTDPGIRAALAWIAQNMNDSGCVRYWDPYAVVGAVGVIDRPEARAILERQVPMLLRGQWEDGGWGDNKWDLQTLDVFRALKTHHLLDKLHGLPPLAPDWEVVRSIPAPEGDLGWMTWQSGRLWMLVWGNGEILGISPDDGAVVKQLKIPDVFPAGLGQWDGALAVTEGRPKKRVLKVDPDTGAVEAEFLIPFVADPMCATMVNGKLWVADSWLFPGWIVDPAHPDRVPKGSPDGGFDKNFRLEPYLAGTCPNGIAAVSDGVWHTDYFARTMIKSGPDGRLLEWAERPFGGWPPDIAWDGRNLWALDAPNRRICVIRKSATAPVVIRPQPRPSGPAVPEPGPADADLPERTSGAPPAPAPAPGAGGPPRRVVLEGVPKVAYHTDRWRVTPFCNALDACLQFLGEQEQYDYLMCTSGAAFRMTWAPQAWDGGNSDILGMAVETLEPMRRAFRAAGYGMMPVAKADPNGWPENILRDDTRRLGGRLTDEAGFRAAIVESINAGQPVIAFGIIGPPEACVITGYDEDGKVLIGWNVFQDDEHAQTEPSGYFRVREWYGRTRALLLIGDKVRKPDPKELDRETLKWALRVLRTPRVRNKEAGPAAFDAWAADMLNDEYFPAGVLDVLRARLMCHWDSMTVTATRGGGVATAYLQTVAAREPTMAEHLRAAADCLDREDVVHGVAPGEEAQIARLADHEVRRQVADSILRARDMHVEAADHIEKALRPAGVPPEEVQGPEPRAVAAPKGRDERVVLEGVPKVGFGVVDGNVQMTPLPACLRACLEYMGDDLGFGRGGKYPRDAVYAYLMGTTGAAFRLLWQPGWHGDNAATFAIYGDPSEIFRRGFAAAGYEQIPSGPVPNAEKGERFRRMAIESVRDRGLPLIAHGVIGPPEEAIIAGYDEDGRVAIGWSFFQDREIGHAGVEFEPSGYFRKRGWEADTWSMMAIGNKVGMPERRGAYIDALQNALRIMRASVRGDCHSGIAAYDAWAEHILRDDEVTGAGGPDDPFIVHCDAADVVAEGRHYASVFLKQAADVLPEAKDELLAAAECFKAEHDLMWKLWGEVGSNAPSEKTRQEFLKPDVRRRIEPIIREARARDAEAADHIEKALLALGAEVPEIPDQAAQPVQRDAAPTMLDGLTFPKWSITELGCIHACAHYLGRDVSRARLYGGTAHAFLINIHEDVDLEAVTAWDRTSVRELALNLGLLIDGVAAHKEQMAESEFRSKQHEAWRFVRRSILLKQPCYGWELKAPYGDYWLITGFDDVGYYYDGWETGGPTPWQKLGDQFIPVLNVCNVKLCEPAADDIVVRDALAAALKHSRSNWDTTADVDAHFGPAAFDAWAHALESGSALHNHHAYNAQAWHECREMAVEFLREAKRRLPGRCDAAFDEALAQYAVVRNKLAALKELTPIDPELGWGKEPKLQSAKAAALVREAGAAERKGVQALRKIATTLEAEGGQEPAEGKEGAT